ncbi:Mce family protein [Gordonia araii NBRC 100433]|uniref:Mce family protein n=1 Tax=Gordonia araii NBRC 100433 TaxID=1073574 RepID=G7GY06_9ACTN|nr:MlaD family protein [Gordonia araii]NNG98092.1 MCE family protein [Gordonia araii NBRC 100433]GAB08481.1 Mce family protein [Gordonia araii NBRC 100433]
MKRIFTYARDVFGLGTVRGDDRLRRHQLLLGGIAIAVVVVVAAGLGLLYLRPIGYTRYNVDLSNASGVRAGDQVRIAGIQVGKVDSLRIDGHRVRMRIAVRNDVHLGKDTSMAIKLLTPVGGRFIQVTPKGSEPLGDTPVPPNRITGTYDLVSLLEEATPKAAELDGKAMRSLVETIERGMSGQPTLVGDLLNSTSSLTQQLAARSDQLRGALHVSDEYVKATATDRQVLFTLVKNLGKIGVELGVRHEQVRRVFNLLTRLFLFLERPILAYHQAIEPSVDAVVDVLERLEGRMNGMGRALTDFNRAFGTVKRMVGSDGITVDDSRKVATGVRLCVPSSGRGC